MTDDEDFCVAIPKERAMPVISRNVTWPSTATVRKPLDNTSPALYLNRPGPQPNCLTGNGVQRRCTRVPKLAPSSYFADCAYDNHVRSVTSGRQGRWPDARLSRGDCTSDPAFLRSARKMHLSGGASSADARLQYLPTRPRGGGIRPPRPGGRQVDRSATGAGFAPTRTAGRPSRATRPCCEPAASGSPRCAHLAPPVYET
jgi:hypothetical protein